MNLKEMLNDSIKSYTRLNEELNERAKFEHQLLDTIQKQQDEIKMLREEIQNMRGEIQNIISQRCISDFYAKSLMEKCLNTQTEAEVQLT